jgi:cellulose synthase/poly-beta-1,6-N-acetylglucosamine synthase-like glycosyltransferase
LLLAAAALAGEPRADYGGLLRKVVRDKGVDYGLLKKERAVLDRYVATLAQATPGARDPDRIAFWINAYNALTLQHVLDHKPAQGEFSVYHDVDEFWDGRRWTVAGRKVTLNEIEHEILRKKFKEPRIHFALNCASRSCPPLVSRLYRGDTLDVVLTQQARAFLADPDRNSFDAARRRAAISEIFRWYKEDFERERGGKVPALQRFLARYAPTEKLARALRKSRWRISYLRYDWRLNEAGRKPARTERVNPIWFVAYLAATLGLLLYGFHAFKMLVWRRRAGRRYREELAEARRRSPLGRTVFPPVCVQVPVFNEPGVVERAIDAVAGLDYPRHALEIQVLDDSTDETVTLVDRAVRRLRARGVAIRALRRGNREGFKAGALAAGLSRSDAEYVAVFDADFVPPADFLRRALPLFDCPGEVACVQGRWGHLNREQNWLTRAQAVGADAHFFIQQFGRAARGAFLNFNGTAGVWRCAAIAEAGGWRGDTLTEDLDLSYRVQLAGRRIVFDQELVVPAELPPTLGAYKSQQRRWACGSIQCARKFLGPVWRSRSPWWVKTEATVHLCGYVVCLAMMALILLLPLGVGHWPMFMDHPGWWPLWLAIWIAALGPLTVALAGQRLQGRGRLREVACCFLLGLGSCANNAIAVLRGLSRPIRTFVRTPKQGSLATPLRTPAPLLEPFMLLFTLASVVALAYTHPWAIATYALFCSAGFWFLTAYWWAVERRV